MNPLELFLAECGLGWKSEECVKNLQQKVDYLFSIHPTGKKAYTYKAEQTVLASLFNDDSLLTISDPVVFFGKLGNPSWTQEPIGEYLANCLYANSRYQYNEDTGTGKYEIRIGLSIPLVDLFNDEKNDSHNKEKKMKIAGFYYPEYKVKRIFNPVQAEMVLQNKLVSRLVGMQTEIQNFLSSEWFEAGLIQALYASRQKKNPAVPNKFFEKK